MTWHDFEPQLRKTAFAIKNSSTLNLPKWFLILRDLELNPRMMPRDVRTRWNSTFDMLNFAVEYRFALDAITGDRDMNLRRYELSKGDWKVATQLRDVLRVSFLSELTTSSESYLCRSSKTRLFSFHEARRPLLPSSRRWTISTNISQRLQSQTSIARQSRQLSRSERRR
jgi:hypothetical protein